MAAEILSRLRGPESGGPIALNLLRSVITDANAGTPENLPWSKLECQPPNGGRARAWTIV